MLGLDPGLALSHSLTSRAFELLFGQEEWKHPTWAAVLGDQAKKELCGALAGSPRGQAAGAAPAGSPDVSGSDFWTKG